MDQRSPKRRRMESYPGSTSTPVMIPQQWANTSPQGDLYPLNTNVQHGLVDDSHSSFATHAAAKWSEATMNPSFLHSNSYNPTPLISSPEQNVWSAFTNLPSGQSTPSGSVNPAGFLPNFIKPLPAIMNQDTVECLHLNGAFALPSACLQNALLQAFAECVLPSMPIVEWQPLIQALNGAYGSHGSISLLLYHAIMVASTTFVDMQYLLEAGYSTRQEAQESFFQRARLIYQTNTETDPLTIIQAFLLMTYRLDTTDGDDSRHLIGIAISTALSIGLFHDNSQTINASHRPTQWRRIAWTCHITDCQIALRLRRKPIIQRSDFCHKMVLESDFEHLQFLVPTSPGAPSDPDLTTNLAAQRELALIFIANARLSVCIRNVLEVQCKESQLRSSSASPSTPTSSTSDDSLNNDTPNSTHPNTIYVSERMLAEWANALPYSCQTNPTEPRTTNEHPTLTLQRSLLHITFYTTIAVFHQSRLFPSSNFCVQHASQEITRVAFDLYRKNLHSRLPIVGVTGILVALVIHISEMKAACGSVQREEAMRNFQLGLEIMANLRGVYSEANRVTSWALKIIQ